MKLIALCSSAVLTLASTAGWAQSPPPKAAPSAVAAPATPAPPAASDAAPRKTARTARVRTDADARACLDLPTTIAIVKCAEKFLR